MCGNGALVAFDVGQGNQGLLITQGYVVLRDSHGFRWVDRGRAAGADD